MPNTPAPTPAIEELLAQPAWIRELARSLVADRSRADDLVQASWLAALRSDSSGVRDARRWFARILRNQASKDGRRAQQRAEREACAARPEALPSTAELVAEVSEQHALTARLLGLEPRSREVLLLRFYRGLSRSAAAAELGISPNTLDSRQSRALELLRTRLDSEYGDRKSWCLALAPLALGGRATAAGQGLLHTSGLAWIGGLFMMIKTHSSAALLVAAALAASLVLKLALDDGLGPGGADTSIGLVELGMRLPDEAPDEVRPNSGRTGGASAPGFVTEVDSCTTLTGSLIDYRGKPLHGIRVAWVQGAAGARKREFDRTADDRAKLAFELVSVTDADGRFELGPIPEGEAGEVVVIGYARESEIDGASDIGRGRRVWDSFTLGMGERVEVDGSRSLVGIVVAMASLEFRVHSPDGRPIEAARIACPYSIRTVRGLDFRLEAGDAETAVQTASTDKHGRAAIERAPYYLGAVVEIRAEGYRIKTLSLVDSYRDLGDIELIPLGVPDLTPEQVDELPDEAAVIRGRVEDPSGQRVEGALVVLGSDMWMTDAQGQFGANRVVVADLVSPTLTIARPGFAPFVTDALELLGNTDPDHFTTFTLDDTLLSIQGHLNVPGEGYSGFRVELSDSIAPGGEGLELLAAGRSGPVEVDASGAFELGGLAAREYRLRIWNAERGIFFESAPLPAGASDVLISVPDNGQRPAIAVRVVNPEGGPFEGARLSLHFASRKLEALGARILFSEPLVTDASGKVTLEGLPMADLVLEVAGGGLEGASIELKASDPLNMLEVALEPLDYMRLNVPPSRRASPWNTSKLAPFDEATALDAAGSPLPMIYIDNFGRRVSTERLRSGLFGFPDFLVGSGFVELVMYAEGVDMSRVSVIPQSPFGINLVDI